MNKFIGVVAVVLALLLVRSHLHSSSVPNGSTGLASESTAGESDPSDSVSASASNALAMPVASVAASAVSPVSTSAASTSLEKSNELSRAFKRLQADSKIPWDTHVDSVDSRLRTLVHGAWGSSNAASPRDAADAFIKAYAADLFGVSPDRLRFTQESKTDRVRVTYQQSVNAVDVYGATLNLYFEDGALTRVQNDLFALEPTRESASVSLSPKEAFADYSGSLPGSVHVSMTNDGRTILFASGGQLHAASDFTVNEKMADGSVSALEILYDNVDRRVIKRIQTQIR